MTGFNKIDVTWRGKQYVIPSDQVLMAVAMVEEVVTVRELCQMLAEEKPKSVIIGRAFAQILRYAGATVTDHEAYTAFVAEGPLGSGQLHALALLITMIMPPDLMAKAEAARKASAGEVPPKGKGRRARSSGRSSSSPAIKRLSSREGISHRSSSGG